ncbi:hypothetical protein, partial [Novacetimonas pomaceti]|uniref:hypothetical protein n=1 Tax=Novacetimonas pomaceti TaxID=2021998 RepID=UPI001C2DA906
LAKAQRFHFRPLGIRQHKAIHTDFESHPDAFKKHNSQQTPKSFERRRLFEKRRHPETFS